MEGRVRFQPLRLPSVRAALWGSALLALLAGCEQGQFGLSGRDAEWARARGDFAVISASAQRVVLSADGNQVAVEPPPGFCLARDEIETSDRSAFVLIGDCVLDADAGAGLPLGDGGLDLAPGMPGIITVSLSGDPGFSVGGASAEDLSRLEAYLDTAEGRALLGRGGDGSQVSVVETRRLGDTLYVLVEDTGAAAVPVLAPRFWRAFVELNDRLAVVTVSGFRDVPMEEDEMLRHLGDQVRQLRMANAVPVDEAPVQYAAERPRPRPVETGSGDEPPDGTDLAQGVIDLGVPEEIRTEGATAPVQTVEPAWEAFAAAQAEETVSQPLTVEGEASPSGWVELAADEAALAAEAAGGDPAVGAVGGPEPGDEGWSALAGAEAVRGAVPNEGQAGGEPRPLAVASAPADARGAWPMPSARPGATEAWPAAAPETRGTAAPGVAPAPVDAPDETAAMPVPPPRLVDPGGRVDGQTPEAGVAVPLPPTRP